MGRESIPGANNTPSKRMIAYIMLSCQQTDRQTNKQTNKNRQKHYFLGGSKNIGYISAPVPTFSPPLRE